MLRNSIMLNEERKVKSEETMFGDRRESQFYCFTYHKVQNSKFKVQSLKDMKYQYTVKGVDYEVEIQDIEGNIANVTVNGIPFEVEMKQPVKAGKQKVKLGGEQTIKSENNNSSSTSAAKATAAPIAKPTAAAAGKPVVAPLPGTINEIKVKVGDKVNAGDTVVILEAMKMQNNIEAETSGTITGINVNKGDAVMEGDTLVTIA